ncbi:hypothetical protein EJ06DRAFT_555822 [Trichodelitschia bisporula]|uniref:DUF7905 domain-containing protein n=1 Tax=Trichodelitschia bisporula TaxID=703511 RepID=A0A6G1HZ50_9PEZI|nr:hypothetical protein EJ06DRAFT_555822 [Trichodelitschia bisporula]
MTDPAHINTRVRYVLKSDHLVPSRGYHVTHLHGVQQVNNDGNLGNLEITTAEEHTLPGRDRVITTSHDTYPASNSTPFPTSERSAHIISGYGLYTPRLAQLALNTLEDEIVSDATMSTTYEHRSAVNGTIRDNSSISSRIQKITFSLIQETASSRASASASPHATHLPNHGDSTTVNTPKKVRVTNSDEQTRLVNSSVSDSEDITPSPCTVISAADAGSVTDDLRWELDSNLSAPTCESWDYVDKEDEATCASQRKCLNAPCREDGAYSARKAFEKNEAHNAEFHVPRGIDLLRIHRSEITEGLKPLFMLDIERSTQVYLLYKQVRGVWIVYIWGTDSMIDQAAAELENWVNEVLCHRNGTKSGSSAPLLVKTTMASAALWETAPLVITCNERKLARELLQAAELWKDKIVDSNKQHPFVVLVQIEYGLQELFGRSLIFMTQLRRASKCGVSVLDPSLSMGILTVILYAEKEEPLVKAHGLLRLLMAQQASKCLPQLQRFLFKPIKLRETDVHMTHYRPYNPVTKHRGNKQPMGSMVLMLEKSSFVECLHPQLPAYPLHAVQPLGSLNHDLIPLDDEQFNRQRLKQWTSSVLKSLKCFGGHISIRAHVGTCVFTNVRRPHGSMMELRNVQALLSRRNGDNNKVKSFFASDLASGKSDPDGIPGLFSALLYAGELSIDLAAVTTQMKRGFDFYRPVYAASFLIRAPRRWQGALRLEVEYIEKFEESGAFLSKHRWFLLKPDTEDLTRWLDVNIIDLKDSKLSYNVRITGDRVLSHGEVARLPAPYTEFLQELQFQPEAFEHRPPKPAWVIPRNRKGGHKVPLLSYHQKRYWRFRVKETGHDLELYTKQAVHVGQSAGRSKDSEFRASNSKWHIELYQKNWDLALDTNHELGVAQYAKWDPEHLLCAGQCAGDCFGSNSYGCERLLRAMNIVTDIVKRMPVNVNGGWTPPSNSVGEDKVIKPTLVAQTQPCSQV